MNYNWQFPYPSQRMPLFAKNVVATSQPLAAQAGLRMLLQGGNAADAALATAIALTVVEPTSNGIGSDAFALLWDGTTLHGLNGSGHSPKEWSPDYFSNQKQMPRLGWDTVTVPGAVDAWATLSKRFGKLPFSKLFEPAIEYASKGFLVSPIIGSHWAEVPSYYQDYPDFGKAFLIDGKAPAIGSRFHFPEQATTLAEIAKTNGESFYRGALAEKIIAHAKNSGGAMSKDDLAQHKSDWVTPLTQKYHKVTLHEIPPNGQGIAALMALGILQHHEIQQYDPDSTESLHLQIEAMKVAFAEINRHLSDPNTMEVTPEALLNPNFLAKRAKEIHLEQARFPKSILTPDNDTVYLTCADENGMMVSFIQSNFGGFGSGIVVPETGISLQNRGSGFTLEKGHPNQVAGGKRPFHTIIPGFVTQNGEPLMSFGVMGGHMQAQGHLQMVVRLFEYQQNPQTAVDAPRWFLTEQNQVLLEKGASEEAIKGLKQRGHSVREHYPSWRFGGAQLIVKLEDGYCAASESRKDGQAVGF